MFKANDVVVYGSQDVCKIISIEDRKIGGETKKTFFSPSVKTSFCHLPRQMEAFCRQEKRH